MRRTVQVKDAGRTVAILLLLCAAGARAQAVSEAELLDYAAQWLARNPLAAQYQADEGVPLKVSGAEEVQVATSSSPFLLVHLNPRGFILMNTDRRLRPIAGFSFAGDANLKPGENNALYELLLVQRQEEAQLIASAPVNPLWDVRPQLHALNATVAAVESPVVGPLLATAWTQWDHYNDECPEVSGAPDYLDGRAYSGCVAVAFSQVMKYYEWPWRGRGSFTYEDTAGSLTGMHTATFSDRYDWANMQNEYYVYGNEPNAATQAVSELMYEVGVAAQTNYELSGSNAYTGYVAMRMPDHFFYESPVSLDMSDEDEMTDVLCSELVAQRPFVAGIPGHAFVVDGYMRDGASYFFHVNYGWAGQNDGWYPLDDITGGVIDHAWVGIRPMLTAIPLDTEYSAAGAELQWVLPAMRAEEAEAVDVLKRVTAFGTFTDPAENFSAFKSTSINDYVDWVLSSEGLSGACFHKPAGGYSNLDYHITSTLTVRPGPNSGLIFKARYRLLDDGLSVAVSTDDGASFSSVWSVSGATKSSWTDIVIPLGAYSGQDIHLRFEYTPGRFYSGGGVWIDDVSVTFAQWYEWEFLHRIEELQAYYAESTVTFQDQAEEFDTFAVTSTSRFRDWTLSADGYTGWCFHKPSNGYSNAKYHLTSTRSFACDPNTFLAFKTRFLLSQDALSISVSTDGGTTFSQVWYRSGTIHELWEDVQIPLAAFAGQDIVLRFEYLVGPCYTDGALWIDDVRLLEITGSEYREGPVYHATIADLPVGDNVLAYQVISADQVHPRSEPFTVTVSE